VEVELRADERTLIVTVSDSGPGVAGDDAEHIFDYGYSTKPASPDGASRGIGLALVSESVARHAGTVELVDSPGGGATFQVTFPDMLLDEPAMVSA
jgi:two-component system, CitB family, sensor kinase